METIKKANLLFSLSTINIFISYNENIQISSPASDGIFTLDGKYLVFTPKGKISSICSRPVSLWGKGELRCSYIASLWFVAFFTVFYGLFGLPLDIIGRLFAVIVALPRLLGPFVQSIVSLTSLVMTNSLTVVAEVFSNTLIFFC